MYGINYKAIDSKGKTIGFKKEEFDNKTRHEVKSIAGREFHKDNIGSVCVFDETGKVHLYLRKDANGSVHREEAE